ncbi:MAG: RNA 3'-terminal phosphate cyclase [Gemmatales bacterium]|nr:RNA 3'-terminal phosphate cyclase [Gemmatales bacterium]
MIEIDGSFGEGGGQILRSSLTLALLTRQAFRLVRIRANRPKPGLQPQHLMCVRAAAQISQAQVQGDAIGSSELVFVPGTVRSGAYHFSIGTAGATSLVLQTVYYPLALACTEPSEVVISGGTHVPKSPCFHFLDTTWRAWLEKLGLRLRLKMRRPGFYPRGGGVLEAQISPGAAVQPLRLDEAEAGRAPIARWGRQLAVTGFSAVAGLPETIAQRQAHRAEKRLRQAGYDCDLELQTWEDGPGTVLALVWQLGPVPTLFAALGERGKPAERVADEAVEELLEHAERGPDAVDPHSADQLLIPLALAPGPSEFPVSQVTSHLLTNAEVVRLFTSRQITVAGDEGQPGRVRIE